MRVVIVGARGQAGRELQATAPAEYELACLGSDRLDIRDREATIAAIAGLRPALVVNAAAYTAVDKAESEESEAYGVNAEGAANVAMAAVESGARLIHISTDFVFDGRKSSPYLPTDATAPLSIYGASKLAGETRVAEATGGQALVVRTAWLYAASMKNFVTTMLGLMGTKERLGVVADQAGTPTWARTLAEAIWAAAAKPSLNGVYHWTDAGVASWYDFAVAIQEEALGLGLLDRKCPIAPIRTEDYPTPATRPAYSVLDKTASWTDFGVEPRHWRQSLREMLKDAGSDALDR